MEQAFLESAAQTEAVTELVTINDWLRWTTSKFAASGIFFGHGSDNPWDEAVQLILPALNLPFDAPKDLLSCKLTTSEKETLIAMLAARINERVPVAYLTNQAYFAGLPFYVDERVLVPRSPFAELINKKFDAWLDPEQEVTRILDMCTGSACIAIALARAFEDAQVDAVDISYDALAVADINISNYQLNHRVFSNSIRCVFWRARTEV